MTLAPLDQKHIAEGGAGDCTACPVMLALSDSGLYPSSMHPDEICWIAEDEGDDDEREVVETSYGLFLWIQQFDEGLLPCEPFTIVVESHLVSTLAEWQGARR